MDNILDMIKKGVPLRAVQNKGGKGEEEKKLSPPSDSHLKLLTESLHRIGKVTRGTSPESDDDNSDDSFED